MTGSTFGPGCGTMVDLVISGNPTSLSSIVVSDGSGSPLGFSYHVESGDLVANCSDQYPDCEYNFYDCTNECGGTAELR